MTETDFLRSCGNGSLVLNSIIFLKNMYFYLHTWVCRVQFPLVVNLLVHGNVTWGQVLNGYMVQGRERAFKVFSPSFW